jgi:transposase InsO family protein
MQLHPRAVDLGQVLDPIPGTTGPDQVAGRHPDLVRRRFRAEESDQLWVADLTFVPTWDRLRVLHCRRLLPNDRG